MCFVSASKVHIDWLRNSINEQLGICGHLVKSSKSPVYQLKYAKKDTLSLIPRMYYNNEVIYLARKRHKLEPVLV